MNTEELKQEAFKHHVDKGADFSVDYPDLPGWVVQVSQLGSGPDRLTFVNREARATLVLGFIQLPNIIDLSDPKIYLEVLHVLVSSIKSSRPNFALSSSTLVTNPTNSVKGIQLIYNDKVLAYDWKGRHVAYFKGSKRYDITAYADEEWFDAADRSFFTPVANSFTFPAVIEKGKDMTSQSIPDEALKLNDEGKRNFSIGQHDRALELLNKAIEIAPQYADAYNNLATTYNAKGDFGKAISFATKAIEMDPQKGIYRITLGHVYYKMNDLDQAILEFRKAIDLGWKEALVYSVLGNCYLNKQMLDEAITTYKKALELNPSLQSAQNNLRTAEALKRSKN